MSCAPAWPCRKKFGTSATLTWCRCECLWWLKKSEAKSSALLAATSWVGFALAVPGIHQAKPYLHSHMLAVREEFQNLGLGRRLKLFQREEALGRGFDLMEWTFDPLEIKNAYFNIERLGAIARRYTVNQYGITSSPLQGGLPTDRLVAEWWLKSPRVDGLVRSGVTAPFEPVKTIAVPAEIYQWKASPAMKNRAKEVQERNREEFLAAFAGGLAALGYERDEHGNGKFLLGRRNEDSDHES